MTFIGKLILLLLAPIWVPALILWAGAIIALAVAATLWEE